MSLRVGLEQEYRAGHSSVERLDGAPKGDPDEDVTSAAHRRPQALALAADHDGEWPAHVGIASGERSPGFGTENPQTPHMEIGQRTGEVVDGAQEQVLDSSRGCLDRGGCQRRLPMCGKEHAVDARSLGAAKERANVLGVLERIEREHEGRLTSLDRPREHVIECCVAARGRHHGDALVAVEAGQRGEGAALDLDDRNP